MESQNTIDNTLLPPSDQFFSVIAHKILEENKKSGGFEKKEIVEKPISTVFKSYHTVNGLFSFDLSLFIRNSPNFLSAESSSKYYLHRLKIA